VETDQFNDNSVHSNHDDIFAVKELIEMQNLSERSKRSKKRCQYILMKERGEKDRNSGVNV